MTVIMPRASSTAKVNGKPAVATKAKSTANRVTKPAQKPAASKKAAATTTTTTKAVATKKTTKTEKAAASKKTTTKASTAPAPAAVKRNVVASKKRAREESGEPELEVSTQPQKRRKALKTPEPVVISKAPKIAIGRHVNDVPSQCLDVFVMGDGANSELGLGPKVYDGGKRPREVKRPRINHNLSPKNIGVVAAAAGGMHSAVITHDNRILTWGTNDGGALGRDVTWDGGLRDMKSDGDDSDSDSDAGDLNPFESAPMAVDSDYFVKGTKFVQVVGSDSATFVLTEDGRVYGWGSFRDDNGLMGFTQDTITKIQKTPMLIPGLSKITKLAAGDNHILALDNKGKVWAWGAGAQSQLGRRIVDRTRHMGLQPCGVGIKNIVDIACGAFHSLAIDKDGRVWAWGSNTNFNCGIDTGAGESNTFILTPTPVDILKDYKVTMVAGGNHHSIACTEDGKLLTWGTNEGHQLGMSREDFDAMNAAKPDSVVYHEEKKEPLMVRAAAEIPTERISDVKAVFSGVDNNFALTADGKVYSWGYNSCYQTGQGPKDFVDVPTVIDNSAVRDRKIVWAGAGGQFSLLAAIPAEE